MRRLIDILLASVALIFLGPLLLLVALVVRLDSPGNPFYGGWRSGLHGERFRMWKFRTMVSGADRLGPGITARNDARITRLGPFLRGTKIDELPQLWNLLLGDLTLVGPRPEVPGIVARYTPEQRKILDAKPGITGPGQIYYTTDQQDTIPEGVQADEYYIEHLLDRKLRIDLDYLARRTAWSDVRLVLDTARFMIRSLLRR